MALYFLVRDSIKTAPTENGKPHRISALTSILLIGRYMKKWEPVAVML